MSDDRLIHEIADRYDPRWLPQRSRDRREYAPPERPSEIRRWRRRLMWLAGLAAAAVVFVPLATNDHRAFQARPVSAAHRLYESDCSLCHDRKGRAAWRLLPGVQAHSVSDAACMDCHREVASSDHHAERHVSGVLETSQSCAQCHVEHLGTEGLFALADQKCVQCHRDLHVA